MTALDLSRVSPVRLASLRPTLDHLSEPPRATAADLEQAMPLEQWSLAADYWGLLRIDGMLVIPDSNGIRFQITPLAIDLPRLGVLTRHGWMRLGAHAELPWSEPLFRALEEVELWSDAFRAGLRHA